MDLEVVKGKEIERYRDTFIQLRMNFYREYPYLYAGNKEFERNYFNMFMKHPDSRLVLAKEEDEVVGAIIGMPLKATMDTIKKPFQDKGKNIDAIYYLGDILVPKTQQGKGIGSALYEEFESIVRGLKKYFEIDLYEITRPQNHPKRTQDYRPLEDFLTKRGYTSATDLKTEFAWKEIGDKSESPHSMVVYLKKVA